MKKIHIILLLAAGLLSFGSAFGVSFWLKKSRPVPADQAAAQKKIHPASPLAIPLKTASSKA